MSPITQLTNEEIQRFITNPLPPPIEFTDRNQNGDYGLLPIELWDKIYDIKHSMEVKEATQVKKALEECTEDLYERLYQSERLVSRAVIQGQGRKFLTWKYLKQSNNKEWAVNRLFKLLLRNQPFQYERMTHIYSLKRPRVADRDFFDNFLRRAFEDDFSFCFQRNTQSVEARYKYLKEHNDLVRNLNEIFDTDIITEGAWRKKYYSQIPITNYLKSQKAKYEKKLPILSKELLRSECC